MDYTKLPDRLAQIANLTEFAKHCDISLRQLQRIRDGVSSPSLATCQKIAASIAAYRPRKKQ